MVFSLWIVRLLWGGGGGGELKINKKMTLWDVKLKWRKLFTPLNIILSFFTFSLLSTCMPLFLFLYLQVMAVISLFPYISWWFLFVHVVHVIRNDRSSFHSLVEILWQLTFELWLDEPQIPPRHKENRYIFKDLLHKYTMEPPDIKDPSRKGQHLSIKNIFFYSLSRF